MELRFNWDRFTLFIYILRVNLIQVKNSFINLLATGKVLDYCPSLQLVYRVLLPKIYKDRLRRPLIMYSRQREECWIIHCSWNPVFKDISIQFELKDRCLCRRHHSSNVCLDSFSDLWNNNYNWVMNVKLKAIVSTR